MVTRRGRLLFQGTHGVGCVRRRRVEAGPTPGNVLPHRTGKDHRGRRSRQGRDRGQHPEGDGVWQSVSVTRVPRPMGRSASATSPALVAVTATDGSGDRTGPALGSAGTW